MVAEGGNLGLTQLGRIEYALAGGRIYTDAIDNSAGVDTSDHEVNIKILLGLVIADGELTEKQRNTLLAQMTDQVAALVPPRQLLPDPVALGRGPRRAGSCSTRSTRFIQFLEKAGRLNRALEFLPADEEIAERRVEEARARRARARGAARLLEDVALRRASSTPTSPRTSGSGPRSAATSRRRCARSTPA